MLFKTKIVSAVVAAVVIAQSVNASAIEPLNMKRITDEDKIYFLNRLNIEQFEKLRQIANHSENSKPPCEKVVEIKKTLNFLKEVNPIFLEASTSVDVSSYARKYSASLARELTKTTKSLNQLLPYYKKACVVEADGKKEAGL